ncbi:transcriptional regulator with XRE-family HTH domain [Paraburkholderia sp. GAS333]|uniref:HAD domain-containing protein n=1 Tax=Paraburkholderia sp. GAS333 TaxID=3156279 RepID=UPI003D1E5AD2
MPLTSSQSVANANPLAVDLQTLGQLVRNRRVSCELSVLDAADSIGISQGVLTRIENGKSVGTERLFKVMTGFGLAMLVMPRIDVEGALQAVGHTVNWHDVMERLSPRREQPKLVPLVMDNPTPTLFVDFDGTLHVGNAYLGEDGDITLDTGRPLLEFAPLLLELLAPYPRVKIVLTTSWARRLPAERVIAYLPPELRPRVGGTTSSIKPRRSYVLDGTERTDVIRSYAYGKRLKHWLAIDDAVRGVERFEHVPGELVDHFLLLNPSKGISDDDALRRISQWLSDVHIEAELEPGSEEKQLWSAKDSKRGSHDAS